MATEVLMPALSPTMEEGTLAKWLVKEGDTVSSGDVIAEIETDKATMEFEAVDEGVMLKILIGDGAEKCAEALADHPANWRFQSAYPSAADLLPEALERLRDGRTEDVADFEPFYLKDFIPGTPKDPLGLRTPSA